MKLLRYGLALTGLLLCAGCSDLVSLHPFVADNESVQDSRLYGVWLDGEEMYVIRADGNGYAINYTEKAGKSVYKLKATMLKAGDARILDVTPADADPFSVSAHTPVRVWIDATTLRWAFLDSKWLRDHAATEISVDRIDDRTVITAPAESVTRFLLTYGADARAFDKPVVLTR